MPRYHSVLLSCALALVTSAAVAQTYDEGETWKYRDQVLGGHLFLQPLLFQSPFITTHFGLEQSGEVLHVNDFPVTRNTSYDVTAYAVTTKLDFGVRLFKRLQLGVSGEADTFSGSSVRSIITGGAGFSYRGGVTAAVRLLRKKNTQLTLRGDFGGGSARKAQLLTLVEALLNQPFNTVTDVIQGNVGEVVVNKASVVTGVASLALAQSLGEAVGLQVSAGLALGGMDLDFFNRGQGQRQELELTLWTPQVGAALGVDLMPMIGAPVQLSGEYVFKVTHTQNKWLDPAHFVAFGAYYSGRPDVQLGLSGVYKIKFITDEGIESNARPYPSGNPHDWALHLSLRYTW